MILLSNMIEDFCKGYVETVYAPVVDRENVYSGKVNISTNACTEKLLEDFPNHEIEKGRSSCRSILFCVSEGRAKDLLNKGVSYSVSPEFNCNVKEPFQVNDFIKLEGLLTMDPSMFDFSLILNKPILTKEEVASLEILKKEEEIQKVVGIAIERRKILERSIRQAQEVLQQMKFKEHLTPVDLQLIRTMFLNGSNLNKFAILFGQRRYAEDGRSRNQFIPNDIGSLFPSNHFGELKPKEVWDKLTTLNYSPYSVSKYEKAKCFAKTEKGRMSA